MRKLILLIVLIYFGTVSIAFPQSPPARAEYSIDYDSDRDPFLDLAMATQIANEENRLVLLLLGGSWCIWCHILDRFFDRNDDYRKSFYETFEVVKVYFGAKNRNEDFLSKFPEIRGYPHIFVLNDQFQLVGTQETSALEHKSLYSSSRDRYDKNRMYEFLDHWIEYLQNQYKPVAEH